MTDTTEQPDGGAPAPQGDGEREETREIPRNIRGNPVGPTRRERQAALKRRQPPAERRGRARR